MANAEQIIISNYFYKDPFTGEEKNDSRLVLAGEELHCGDEIEVLTPDGWQPTRVEKGSTGWYLVGISLMPVGLIARLVDEE